MIGKQSQECPNHDSPADVIYKLVLEDRVQALRTLYVIDGIIVYSGLVQRLFWEQRALTANAFVKGDLVQLKERSDTTFEYRIEEVTRIERVPRYAAWLAKIDQYGWAHWRERDYTKRSGANQPGDSWIESYLEGLSPAEAWTVESNAASACDNSPLSPTA